MDMLALCRFDLPIATEAAHNKLELLEEFSQSMESRLGLPESQSVFFRGMLFEKRTVNIVKRKKLSVASHEQLVSVFPLAKLT